jgi:chemotaxis response regulator CheB
MLRQITVIWSLYKPQQMATSVILGGEPVNGFRPSVEVLFDSVRKASGDGHWYFINWYVIDGSQAILRMKEQGNHTICQDRNTSIVWIMAGTAVELGLRIKRDQYTEFLFIL